MEIAVLGYGTVGSGVVEVLEVNQKSIAQKAGENIHVKYVLDLRDFFGQPIQDRIVHDYETILNDPEIKIVVEVLGGVEPAYTYVRQERVLQRQIRSLWLNMVQICWRLRKKIM